jgi:hypothetical protein
VRRDIVILCLVLGAACAGHSATLPPAPEMSASTDPATGCSAANGAPTSSVITRDELQGTGAANVYEAIRRIRPAYFDSRGPSSIYNDPGGPIVVIANRHVIGGVDELREMDTAGLVCVRRLPAAEVSLLTGTAARSDGIELVFFLRR